MESVKHHLIVTIQLPGRVSTRDQILTIPTTYTRSQVYKHVRDQLVSEHETDDITILFYSLEPEQL
ncbi:hypothetical protein [[Kitasatospora] papulosa]|uniref:hypothetical protein n=1 Tax=[Kitasatospora] papulosa TaxID=1464011 RepID=UPI0036BEB844